MSWNMPRCSTPDWACSRQSHWLHRANVRFGQKWLSSFVRSPTGDGRMFPYDHFFSLERFPSAHCGFLAIFLSLSWNGSWARFGRLTVRISKQPCSLHAGAEHDEGRSVGSKWIVWTAIQMARRDFASLREKRTRRESFPSMRRPPRLSGPFKLSTKGNADWLTAKPASSPATSLCIEAGSLEHATCSRVRLRRLARRLLSSQQMGSRPLPPIVFGTRWGRSLHNVERACGPSKIGRAHV